MKKISETNLSISGATLSIRFGHYVIDILAFYVVLIVLALVLETLGLYEEQLFTLISYPAFFLYYTLFEGLYGVTAGKIVFGSVVVNDYGNKIDLSSAALRTIIRFIPFEAFSMFGAKHQGWHDRWSKTYVIRTKDLPTLQAQLNQKSQDLDEFNTEGESNL